MVVNFRFVRETVEIEGKLKCNTSWPTSEQKLRTASGGKGQSRIQPSTLVVPKKYLRFLREFRMRVDSIEGVGAAGRDGIVDMEMSGGVQWITVNPGLRFAIHCLVRY